MSERESLKKLQQFDLFSAPGHLLRRNNQRSLDIFASKVGDDVTRQQIGTLLALYRWPGASQRDLVQSTGVDKSTLKEMLGRMVKRGWVERERDPVDSRAWTMHLTRDGLALLLDRIDKVEAAQHEILAPLSEEDRRTFMRLLRQLAGVETPSDAA